MQVIPLLPTSLADVRDVAEAHAQLQRAFALQVEQAEIEGAPPNVGIHGDSHVRKAFWALLTPENQRHFFLKIAADRRYWPRLRTLVGSPPYSFLRPEDEGGLRAGGIQAGRVHLAPETVTATSYSEFGSGHFEDPVGRLYRIVSRERASASTLLPWDGLEPGLRVAADVRVQKRSAARKVEIAKGKEGAIPMASLLLPRVGEILNLTRVPQLRTADQPGATLRARVEVGRQKAANSPVARLVLKLL